MKGHPYIIIALILTMLATAGCDRILQLKQEGGTAPMGRGMAGDFASDTMQGAAKASVSQKLMRTASIQVEVRCAGKAGERARELVEEMGGLVANSSAFEDDAGVKSLRMTLKVPADRIDEALSALADLGRVRAEDVSAEDVTEEYFDMETRLANAKRLEKRFLELLEFKTKKLKDVLDTEKELARVREKIERLEGRKRYMDNRIEMATIEATFVEPRGFGRGIFDPLSGIFQRSLGALTASIAALIVVISALIPWLILLLFMSWGVLKLLRAYIRHKREKKKKRA